MKCQIVRRTEAKFGRGRGNSFCLALALGAVLLVAGLPVAAQRSSSYQESFEKIVETVRKRFWDKNLNGVNWGQVTETYQGRLKEVKSRREFAALMNRMLEELRASHVAYATRDDIEFAMLPSVMGGDLEGHKVTHIGVMGRYTEQGYLVTGVLEGNPAILAGIQVGDRLLTVGDEPFTTVGAFVGKEREKVEVTLKRAGENAERKITVIPVKQNPLQAFLDATNKSARVLNVDGKRLGYIHLWTMGHSAFRDSLENQVLGKLYETDGLILDLRDGYGGHPFGYSDPFFRPDIAWTSESRGNQSIQRAGYTKPMVVLTNEGTRSAKEYLAYQFKKSRRATLVGTKTAGAFLGAGMFFIGDDGLLELPVVGLQLDGKRLEGVGVAPDVEVAPAFSYQERDAQMQRAKTVLLDLIRQQSRQVVRKM